MADLLDQLGVTGVTRDRLSRLVELLNKWNPAINLVARSTLDQAWDRHILDSAQLYRLAPKGVRRWADLGSGGGYPGLVIAILAAELSPQLQVILVESDRRKATFLQQAARELGVQVQVEVSRIEALAPLEADVVSARALAALPMLCGFVERHLAAGGVALFPKGANWKAEVDAAQRQWRFALDWTPSLTDGGAVILKLGNPVHV